MIFNKYLGCLVVAYGIFLGACQVDKGEVASFNTLVGNNNSSTTLSANNAQEIDYIQKKDFQIKGLEYEVIDDALQLTAIDKNATLTFKTVKAGLPVSWKGYRNVKFSFQNKGMHECKATITLWASRGRMIDTLWVSPRSKNELLINLHDLPLISGPNDKYIVDEISIGVESAINEELVVTSISLLGQEDDFTVVDRFGQRISTTWPEKVEDEIELKQHLNVEHKKMANAFSKDSYDRFLGFKSSKKYTNTGFFSVGKESVNGVDTYFFVTPEGNPFWSFGVNGVRPKKARTAVTLVDGYEQLFESLPSQQGPYASTYIGDSTMSFYNLNLLKKYGNLQDWREMSFNRLRSWGLNTIGNWAEDSLLRQSQLPFTYSFETDIAKWQYDVFNKSWTDHIDSVFSNSTSWKENPFLIGYFVDNEGGWGNLKLLEKLSSHAMLRQVLKQELMKEFGGIEVYNQKYHSAFTSWDELVEVNESKKMAEETIIFLERLYTERYFQAISTTLKKHDPNHLYLGCRFTRKPKPPHIMQIAGKYCDVITVNVYSYEPIKEEMEKWHEQTGKPILIGEHQAALKSARQLPLRWQTFDENERYLYFSNYVQTWAKMPFSLGSHWYQYVDQHVTGRASNGENQIVGFVDITDQPYAKMIDAARINSTNIYQWHQLE